MGHGIVLFADRYIAYCGDLSGDCRQGYDERVSAFLEYCLDPGKFVRWLSQYAAILAFQILPPKLIQKNYYYYVPSFLC